MIEINLIPQNKRKKKRGQILGIIKIPLEILIGSIVGVVILMIGVHIGLLGVNVLKLTHQKNLQKQWDVIAPAKENVDKVIKEMRELQTKHKAIDKITTGSRILWAQKLNILSDSIVRGVWLTRVRLNEGTFYIEGSAVSKQSDEVIGVHPFTSNLKQDKMFVDKFVDLDLDSIQRRFIGKTEVADFIITARVVQDEGEDGK